MSNLFLLYIVLYLTIPLGNGTSWGHVEFASEKDAQTVLKACVAKPFHFMKKDIRIEAATDMAKPLEPSQWIAIRGLPLDTAPQTVADLFGVGLEKVTMCEWTSPEPTFSLPTAHSF